MAHEQYQEMLAVHALSALDDADERALIEHLRTCTECRAELDQWRTNASALAFMSTPAEPSPKVRERILAQVRAELEAGANSNESAPPPSPAKVVPFVDRRAEMRRRFGALEAIAATIVVALLIGLFMVWRQNQATQREVATLTEQNRVLHEQLRHEREIVAFMSKPGSRLTDLGATPLAPGAQAKIVYDKNGTAMLLAKGLPAPPAGKEYQLWFIVGNDKMPGKTFGTDPTGSGGLNDHIPASAMQGAVFAITLEPTGGMPQPTGGIYLVSGS
jgi:anti-sigma-K factor RskA